jgi:hypothetical protein
VELSRLEETLNDLRARRKAHRSADLSSHIETLLVQQWSHEDTRVLRGELISECQRHGRFQDAARLLQAEVDREPQEPYYSLSLAEHYHYYDIDLACSLRHVADAIAKAGEDGKFMYQALGVQARLALETQNWQLLQATLRELAEYEHTPGNADVFPETDFVARIPNGAVPTEAIAAYLQRVEHLRTIGYSTMYGARGVQT